VAHRVLWFGFAANAGLLIQGTHPHAKDSLLNRNSDSQRLLIPVNVISFKWTSEFFREQLSTAFIRLKDRMPELDGSKYFGKKGTES